MKIDKLSFQIAGQLLEGRKSFREIAQELAVAENTVRSRINKMQKEGVMDIVARLDVEKLPGHTMVFTGVLLDERDLFAKCQELSQLRGVVSGAVVTGRFDIILTLLLRDGYGLLEFYSEEMSKIEGIRSVESFVVYKGSNLMTPYILDPNTLPE
ncbi:Lrp/AsnC family transcriptional regulator [Halodesulfovibrio sp.]|uniref:Lrp/AsnC family transcriptional regulator n=1 Tax=Halodesulfovibrio sp. TaxID=1912772 RepID=UPI0025C49B51|nr:Lrp/AsnC family transcriptional regulator [Halodesulfovibrio sp.]